LQDVPIYNDEMKRKKGDTDKPTLSLAGWYSIVPIPVVGGPSPIVATALCGGDRREMRSYPILTMESGVNLVHTVVVRVMGKSLLACSSTYYIASCLSGFHCFLVEIYSNSRGGILFPFPLSPNPQPPTYSTELSHEVLAALRASESILRGHGVARGPNPFLFTPYSNSRGASARTLLLFGGLVGGGY
jgi:hypothetical protein